MKELSCAEVVDRIPALVAGDLTEEEIEAVDVHVAGCPACAREVGQGRALSEILDRIATRGSVAARADAALPALRERLRELLPQEAAYARINSPLGPLYLVASASGLCRVSYGGSEEETAAWSREQGLRPVHDAQELRPYAEQLRQYFAGERRQFDIPVDLRAATPFARRVLAATANVPFGRLVSYRDIARDIGKPGATRAVGNALGSNPVPIVVPCHRVIRSDGTIGGYTGGLSIKWRLLSLEGSTLSLPVH